MLESPSCTKRIWIARPDLGDRDRFADQRGALPAALSLRGAERRSNLVPSGVRLLCFARNNKVAAINAIGEDDDGRDQIRRAFQHPGQRYLVRKSGATPSASAREGFGYALIG